jgi:hypothetical protein
MSDTTFGIIAFCIAMVGVIGYATVMLRLTKVLHDAQRDYYQWLKRGGGQVRHIASHYTKEDVERLK